MYQLRFSKRHETMHDSYKALGFEEIQGTAFNSDVNQY